MAFNKKELDQSFKSFSIDGFTFKKEIMGYSWTKEYLNRTERIIIGYRGYPDSYVSYTPTVTIYFPEVENILENFKKVHFPDKHFGNGTIHKSFVKLQNIDYSKFEIEIKDEKSFNEVALEIKKIIEIGALPFFKKFNDLMTVFEITETMEIEEMADFIVQPLPQRRMVIKKLCNDSNYQEYVDWLIEYYKSENDEEWKELEQLDIFLKTMQST